MIPPISRRRRSLGSLATTLLLLASTSCLLPAQAQNLTASQLDAVKQRLAEGAQQSWELGTRAQALIELDTPSYSVLTTDVTLPPPTSSPPGSLGEVWSIVQAVIANRSLVTASGPQPLISADGAAGDPASLGVAVLLANWTGLAPPSISPVPVVSSSASSSSISSAPSSNSSRSSEPTATSSSVTPTPTVFATPTAVPYADAASSQLSYLLTVVQRTSDGAISHRADQLQLWSDFVYMVPPFLTYYGVLTNNETLATMGYDQCRLYRQYLQDASAGGLWKHIVLGNNTDPGHWSTGNAWAAAGMARVMGTLARSQFAKQTKSQQTDLATWMSEIHSAMYAHIRPSLLFGNYADDANTFDDAASAALLASTVYRLALLAKNTTLIAQAEQVRAALFAPSNSSSSSSSSSTSTSSASTPSATSPSDLQHFTSDMWLTPVVNPHQFGLEGSESPEGQAFVVELDAAWRDWVAAGSPGVKSAAVRVGGGGVWTVLVAVLVGAALVPW